MSGIFKGDLQNQLGDDPREGLENLLKKHRNANQVARACDVSRQAVVYNLNKYGFKYNHESGVWSTSSKSDILELCEAVGVAETAKRLNMAVPYVRKITNRVE